MSGPWTFDQAVSACQGASRRQADAEGAMREASRDYALAEEAFRIALAKEIVRQHHDEHVAWTVAPDLARGNPSVAALRRDRDIAEGVRDAMQQLAWRRSADRKDAQRYADWSQRLDVREQVEPDWSKTSVIGGRKAA
jgi:hypothetical protein